MKCLIRANNVELSKKAREQYSRRVEKAFSRVSERIQFVVVSFQAIKVRGGNDKRCVVTIVGENVKEVKVYDIHHSPQAAFGLALSRSKRAFIVQIKKRIYQMRGALSSRKAREVQALESC